MHLTTRLIADIFRLFFRRVERWFRHVFLLPHYVKTGLLYGLRLPIAARFSLWLGEFLFLFLDILGVPEWYEIGNCWIKGNSRPLTGEEKQLAGYIFGNTLPLDRLQLDERARIGPKQYHFCYVSFCVINSWETMPPAILVHELVHVWQFQRYGSPYILRALLAQRTPMGYDYGGLEALQRVSEQGLGLEAFNYEQQASIIEDYFRLHRTGFARWSADAVKKQLSTYQYFVDSLQKH